MRPFRVVLPSTWYMTSGHSNHPPVTRYSSSSTWLKNHHIKNKSCNVCTPILTLLARISLRWCRIKSSYDMLTRYVFGEEIIIKCQQIWLYTQKYSATTQVSKTNRIVIFFGWLILTVPNLFYYYHHQIINMYTYFSWGRWHAENGVWLNERVKLLHYHLTD